jgi:hypothetical protein
MRNALILSGLLGFFLFDAPLARAEEPIAATDVLKMMDTMPAAPGDPRSKVFRWSSKPGAARVAEAIVAAAPDREWAARMAVYAIHESGLSMTCVAGDGGSSRGPWQLQGVSDTQACDPALAAPIWLAKARQSIADCASLAPAERMAELASGSCAKGHMIARLRESFVLRALAAAP